ncbi:MAG: polysaccharide biosynthesis tyrosine autokinase [Bacteroidetes bacterium]|nr:polysaccharide biosynthesis tyrosine autokinase [Bacteroidota bacterium]
MLAVLKRNWLVVPLMILIALALSFLYLRYTKPLYQSSAVIQRSSQDEGKRVLDIEGFEQENKLSEDVELLRSTFLLEKALRNLNLSISYFSEGDILTEEKYLFSPYHITLLELKDSSLIGKQIHVTKNGENIQLMFDHKNQKQAFEFLPGEEVSNEFFRLVFKINDEAAFLQNLGENDLYFVFNDIGSLTRSLLPSLNVYTLNEEARTIEIKFASNNPRLAMDVVQTLINTFFEYDLEKKSESSASILDFIDSQLDTVFTQLRDSENKIQSFKDSSKINDPELFTQNVMNRINDLQVQLMAIDFDHELMKEVERTVRETDRIEIFNIIPAIIGTPYENMLVDELEKLHSLLVQKEDASYTQTEATENYKRITRSIDSQTKNIFRIIGSLTEQLGYKRKNLQDKIAGLESQLYDVPATQMELSRLDRMFNLNEKYYTLLIEKKTQYAISKAGYTMDNMVLQSPTEAILISPNKTITIAGSVVIAFLLSFIFLLVRYITFNDIHNPDELKKLLPSYVGFLGMLPRVITPTKNSTLIVHLQPKSALAESYRHIRSNLHFILDENKKNVVAVSSSVSGEGKTFVTLNLAGIFAMMGKKVLVIDLDLRKPKVHHGFNAPNTNGMSTILAEKANWRDCVNKSEIEGLDFITAGPIPPNPSELIIGGRLEKVIEEFKTVYDMIMIDNPPVGIVSDGIGVLNRADCPIYVLRANYSKRMFVHRITDLIESKKVPKLFVLLNSVDSTKTGYGYAYGYSYGDYYTDENFGRKPWYKFWKK